VEIPRWTIKLKLNRLRSRRLSRTFTVPRRTSAQLVKKFFPTTRASIEEDRAYIATSLEGDAAPQPAQERMSVVKNDKQTQEFV
jgi:hypothetical protein